MQCLISVATCERRCGCSGQFQCPLPRAAVSQAGHTPGRGPSRWAWSHQSTPLKFPLLAGGELECVVLIPGWGADKAPWLRAPRLWPWLWLWLWPSLALPAQPRAGGTAAAGPALPQGRCGDGPGGRSAAMAARVLNVNVGVLGHIDSGKTALARALSTTGSTAAFDRAPQSRARGITLDLGFSCLRTALPPQLGPGPGELQFTLVDCPGHASLIRTIIGGKGGAGLAAPARPAGCRACRGAPALGGVRPCRHRWESGSLGVPKPRGRGVSGFSRTCDFATLARSCSWNKKKQCL